MANCSINLNQLQQASGCPDDAEKMLFIGVSGYSGFSGVGLRTWGDLTKCTTSGYSGFSGFSGSGFSGYSGESGASGYSGFSGFSGNSTSGFSGYSGRFGNSGASGYSGFTPVSQGLSGYSGAGGNDGASGYSGVSGLSGDNPGLSGYSGYSGRSGYSGFDATAQDTWRTVFTTAYSEVPVPASSTTWGQLFGQIPFFTFTELTKEYVIPEDSSAENLFIKTSGTQPASGALVVTIRKNFVDTLLAVTIPAGGSAAVWSNTSDVVSVNAGDTITMKIQNLATSNSINILSTACSLFKV